jgi:hypothetical protein
VVFAVIVSLADGHVLIVGRRHREKKLTRPQDWRR